MSHIHNPPGVSPLVVNDDLHFTIGVRDGSTGERKQIFTPPNTVHPFNPINGAVSMQIELNADSCHKTVPASLVESCSTVNHIKQHTTEESCRTNCPVFCQSQSGAPNCIAGCRDMCSSRDFGKKIRDTGRIYIPNTGDVEFAGCSQADNCTEDGNTYTVSIPIGSAGHEAVLVFEKS